MLERATKAWRSRKTTLTAMNARTIRHTTKRNVVDASDQECSDLQGISMKPVKITHNRSNT